MTRDITAYGAAAARRLLDELAGETTGDVEQPRAELQPRGSTGAAALEESRADHRRGRDAG